MLIWLVNMKDVSWLAFNGIGNVFVADSSDLEIPPGKYPDRLRTEDIGDGTDFLLQDCSSEGDRVHYVQPSTKAEIYVL